MTPERTIADDVLDRIKEAQTMKSEHRIEEGKATPRPWISYPSADHFIIDGGPGQTRGIAKTYDKDNATLIIAAVNSYYKLKADREELLGIANKMFDFIEDNCDGTLDSDALLDSCGKIIQKYSEAKS